MVMETGQSWLSHDFGSRASHVTTMGLFCPGGGIMLNIDATELTADEVIELIAALEGTVSIETKEWVYTVYTKGEE